MLLEESKYKISVRYKYSLILNLGVQKIKKFDIGSWLETSHFLCV